MNRRVCPDCGLSLDPGEKCECQDTQKGRPVETEAASQETLLQAELYQPEAEMSSAADINSLIVVKQLPVIEERLRTLKDRWEQRAADAESMVCTEDTIRAVKAFRAEMNKELEDVESSRKTVKNAVMGPYNAFEAVYKYCITDAYKRAYAALTIKINKVELDIKTRCEDGLREYFAELCAVHHLDWLTYEQAGIRVDMASAKAKTPKKLREQILRFVVGAANDIESIAAMDDAEEILAEYKQSLDAAGAIRTVLTRRQRIADERQAQAERAAAQEREVEMVRRVEALAPPVVAEAPEKSPDDVFERFTYTVFNVKRSQLWKIREFLNMEGIKYE